MAKKVNLPSTPRPEENEGYLLHILQESLFQQQVN